MIKKELTIKDVFKRVKKGESIVDAFHSVVNEAHKTGAHFFLHKPKNV